MLKGRQSFFRQCDQKPSRCLRISKHELHFVRQGCIEIDAALQILEIFIGAFRRHSRIEAAPGSRKDRNRSSEYLKVDRLSSCHRMRMTEQPETGDIGASSCPDGKRLLRSFPVERKHPADSFVYFLRSGLAAFQCSRNHADADRFGQHQQISWLCSGDLQNTVSVPDSGDCKAEFDFGIVEAMSPGEDGSRFPEGVRCSADNVRED